MSGLEILGLLASAAQLATSSINIVTSISEIYHRIQDAPEKIQKHTEQVDQLVDTAYLIKKHELLQTENVALHIRSTLTEAILVSTILKKIQGEYLYGPSIRRSWKILKGNRERQILSGFERLEQEKSALLMSISIAQTDILGNIQGTLEWSIGNPLVWMSEPQTQDRRLKRSDGDVSSARESTDQAAAPNNQLSKGNNAPLSQIPQKGPLALTPIATEAVSGNHGCPTGCETTAKTVKAEATVSEVIHHRYVNMTSAQKSTQMNGDLDLQSPQTAKGSHYQGGNSNDTSTQVNGNASLEAVKFIVQAKAEHRGPS